MARHKLTEAAIKRLEKPGIYSDGDGLFLRVRKGGSRQWFFITRRGGKRAEIGLGGYGQGTAPVSLALAREKADNIRNQLARGIDPRDERKPARVITFRHVMDELLASKEGGWKNEKHRAQWHMTLRDYAEPLHDLAVAEIAIGDVKAALEPHWTARPVTADRLRSRIQAVLDYAIAHGWRTAGNVARWQGLLDKVMPPRQKAAGHHAALAYDDAPTLATALRQSSGVAARAVEFVMLTAARTGEARWATFDEIDTAARIWTVPADRMKAGKEHVVPLTDRALAIVEAMRQRATSGLIFGGGVEDRPVSDTAMTKALRLASPDKSATLHGLRSTFRDWCGDKTDFPRDVAEAALAHTLSDKTEAAYRRGTALEKRRELMTAWAGYLNG
ncbi:MAG: integrase arm-type DNA-binding domain-containing protein [Sphingopyxis sp.]|uniref:tyrosine-type recombinase/integrase n=1 Tax=Sphingopyxis sp. TaxID=1908224 RepID=UPI001A3892E1|nr:site-specific integrase [Sphingopyxis sp.]MBL9066467.1 integrase arm-type DNA-binding domain-containing protein [Sphingopyxis sp.]